MRNGQLFFDTLIFIEFCRIFDFFIRFLSFRGFRSDSKGRGGLVFDGFQWFWGVRERPNEWGRVGRSVGQVVGQVVGRSPPPSPPAPREVWSDIASSVW